MVSMFTTSMVGHGFKPWSKNKDWLDQSQDNVSKGNNMSVCGLLFQWASNTKIKLGMFLKYKTNTDIAENCSLVVKWRNNHSHAP
jgi:hypothetical protein